MLRIRIDTAKVLILSGILIYFAFGLKEIGNFYQTGHAGFINAEVGISHLNTIHNGFLKTKLASTNYRFIYNRAPEAEEYYVRYPYLHNLLISLLWTITGPSEVATRLFMMLLVLASFLVIYLLTRRLEWPRLSSALAFFTLCSFPIFYHYAGLSNGEISALLPLALSCYFYLRYLKENKKSHLWLFLLSLSFTCQLFWVGYVAGLVFLIDSSLAFLIQKKKQTLLISSALIVTVMANILIYILHTLWLVGALQNVFQAFLWRGGWNVPQTQQFTLADFIVKNLKRWWLFNPAAILFSLLCLPSFLRWKNSGDWHLEKRILLILFFIPLTFSLALRHLVQYHDFLVVYFAFFLALAATAFFPGLLKKFSSQSTRSLLLFSYLFVLLAFAASGLFHQPEEKMIDRETDNYELYYLLKVIRNTTQPSDRFLATIRRLQEPQVTFYLRRELFFMKVIPWAKGYIDSGRFSHYLVENKPRFQPLIKYLLDNYRGHKYDRYFLFSLKKPGPGLRVFTREEKKTNWLFKYFISPYHQPGGYREIISSATLEMIYDRFREVPDLY